MEETDPAPQDLPWLRLLPSGDRLEFVRELVAATAAAKDADPTARVLQLITEWRYTAQVYAAPGLLEILRSEVTGDAGGVPAPTPES